MTHADYSEIPLKSQDPKLILRGLLFVMLMLILDDENVSLGKFTYIVLFLPPLSLLTYNLKKMFLNYFQCHT